MRAATTDVQGDVLTRTDVREAASSIGRRQRDAVDTGDCIAALERAIGGTVAIDTEHDRV